MKKTLTKSTVAVNNISLLPTKPLIGAALLQALFDKTGSDDKTYINALIDEIQAETLNTSGSFGVGHNSSTLTAKNVGDVLIELRTAITTAEQNFTLGAIADNSLTEAKMAAGMKKQAGGVAPFDTVTVNTAAIATKATGTGTATGTNTGDQRVPKTARFTVGTSTSGWTAGDCDYLCDGINDQIKINAAITALPATGGEIVILDGTYNITAKISVNKANVTLSGNGNGTILKRMYNSTLNEGIIQAETGANECKVRDFYINGNKATYTNTNNHGILLLSSGNAITGNTCKSSLGTGIYSNIQGYNTIIGNICNSNTANGIFLNGNDNIISGNNCDVNDTGISLLSSSNNAITGNRCNGNTSNGIYLNGSPYNTITGNTCNSNSVGFNISSSLDNSITGNTFINNTNIGVYLLNSNNNIISNNKGLNGTYGMLVDTSSRNNITGNNLMRGTGLPGDYTASQYTIILSGGSNNYNLVSSNLVMGKDAASSGGTSNTFVNNKFA